jgi:hypothetical protein
MAGTSDWKDELESWLKSFLDTWVIRRGGGCVRFMIYVAGLIGPGVASRASGSRK